MLDILTKLKKTVLEQRIYALLIKSSRGQVLHLGMHFSLDEAYLLARKRMEDLTPIIPGESVDIELWNSLSIRDIIVQSVDPSKIVLTPQDILPFRGGLVPVKSEPIERIQELPNIPTQSKLILTIEDRVKNVNEARNDLLKKLIETGDISQVEKLKSPIVTATEKRYIIDRIEKKNAQNLKGPVN